MTLPELLAAVAVIMIALLALASGIPIASYGIQEGSQLTTATFLANQRMEQVKATSWTLSVDNLGTSASATAAPQGGGPAALTADHPSAAAYTQILSVANLPASVLGSTAALSTLSAR